MDFSGRLEYNFVCTNGFGEILIAFPPRYSYPKGSLSSIWSKAVLEMHIPPGSAITSSLAASFRFNSSWAMVFPFLARRFQISGHGLGPLITNLTAASLKTPSTPRRSILLNRVTASIKGLTGSLRFDKSFDPAGRFIHSKYDKALCDLCALAVQDLSSDMDFTDCMDILNAW